MEDRPFGITILGVLAFLNGLIGLCIPILLVTVGGLATTLGGLFGSGVALAAGCLGVTFYFIFLYLLTPNVRYAFYIGDE